MVDINDLMKLAKVDLKEAQENTLDEIDRFITTFDLRRGRTIVPIAEIYNLYSKWSLAPVGSKTFHMRFGRVFKRHRKKSLLHYLLNKKCWEIDFLLRKLMKRYGEEVKEEEQSDSHPLSGIDKGLQSED